MTRHRLRAEWFCHGCQKMHLRTRDIEGENFAGYWCAHAIRKGVKARRNDLPFIGHAYERRRA